MTTTAWPSIPTWQQAELVQLGQEGALSGVTPRAVGVIDSAESSGKGGGITPGSGAGGYFGLVAGSPYKGGAPSAALLEATTATAFASQAEISASAFNTYLGQTGGTYVAAEEVYQSGSASGPTNGSQEMAQYGYGNGATTTGFWQTLTNAGSYLTPWGLATHAGGTLGHAAGGAVSNAIGGALSGAEHSFAHFLAEALVVVAGAALVVLGFYKMASPNHKTPDLKELADVAPELAA